MKNKTIIIILIILIVITISLGIFLFIKNKNEPVKENEQVEKVEEKEEVEEEKVEETTPNQEEVCSGTFNATYTGKYSSNSINEEITIKLNEDGTYEKSIKEGEYQKGTYSIMKNNISFEFIPSGAPPSAKSSYSYKISNDCSEITIRNNDFSYIAHKN